MVKMAPDDLVQPKLDVQNIHIRKMYMCVLDYK